MMMIQFIFLREGSNRIYQESKSFVSCSHMNCCLPNYITHQFTYFIYDSHQDKFKNSRIIKIHQVHQKLSRKHDSVLGKIIFLFQLHLNFSQNQIFR